MLSLSFQIHVSFETFTEARKLVRGHRQWGLSRDQGRGTWNPWYKGLKGFRFRIGIGKLGRVGGHGKGGNMGGIHNTEDSLTGAGEAYVSHCL